MSPSKELTFKQTEISVRRFNEIAIPHHMGLLRNHRSNIEKSLALGDWNKIRKEEINALRVIKQLKNLLMEMEILREKLSIEDRKRFDALIEDGKQTALNGMKEYLLIKLNKRNAINIDDDLTGDTNNANNDNYYCPIGSTMAHQKILPDIETNFNQNKYQLEQRQACFEELENLQHEIQDLNSMFHNMHQLVHEQAEQVDAIADNAEEALENVQAGERQLRQAVKYKKAMYPVVGALVGTCVGGPIGLVAGLKAGGIMAFGCGLLGFAGCSLLKKEQDVMLGNVHEENQLETDENEQQQQQQHHQQQHMEMKQTSN